MTYSADTHTWDQISKEKLRVDLLIGAARKRLQNVKRTGATRKEFIQVEQLEVMEAEINTLGHESQRLQLEMRRAKEIRGVNFEKEFMQVCRDTLPEAQLKTLLNETHKRMKGSK